MQSIARLAERAARSRAELGAWSRACSMQSGAEHAERSKDCRAKQRLQSEAEVAEQNRSCRAKQRLRSGAEVAKRSRDCRAEQSIRSRVSILQSMQSRAEVAERSRVCRANRAKQSMQSRAKFVERNYEAYKVCSAELQSLQNIRAEHQSRAEHGEQSFKAKLQSKT